jgi:acyl carrier protein
MGATPDSIRGFVQNKIRQAAVANRQPVPEVDDHFNLVESGLFDSLGFVDLFSSIEKNFGLIIDVGDMAPEELIILGNLVRAVARSSVT